MVLPIYALGQPVLKKMAEPITKDYEGLDELIKNMWETMYYAQGIGLAAPQIGKSIRLFLIDTVQAMEEGKESEGVRRAFINAEKIEEGGTPWDYEEGCLSIPDIRGDVKRPAQIKLKYLDENFEEKIEVFSGIHARVIQHEYDHIDGILFTEHLKPLKRRLLKRRLEKVKKGDIECDYKMKFVRSK